MLRRDALKTLGLAAAFSVTPHFSSGIRKNFIWLRPDTKKSADSWKRDFALMKESGIDAINAEIYDGSSALYASTRFPVRAQWLEMALQLAKDAGLEVHAWMWTMVCLVPEIVQKHADWYNVNAKGESAATRPAYVDYYKFMDPARPDVREFVRDTVRELASMPGLTGIHLDYVRHPDAILPSGLWSKYGIVQDKVYPACDYGYGSAARNSKRARRGSDDAGRSEQMPRG